MLTGELHGLVMIDAIISSSNESWANVLSDDDEEESRQPTTPTTTPATDMVNIFQSCALGRISNRQRDRQRIVCTCCIVWCHDEIEWRACWLWIGYEQNLHLLLAGAHHHENIVMTSGPLSSVSAASSYWSVGRITTLIIIFIIILAFVLHVITLRQ